MILESTLLVRSSAICALTKEKKKNTLDEKTLETYIFRTVINVFTKGESDTIDAISSAAKNNSREFHSVPALLKA